MTLEIEQLSVVYDAGEPNETVGLPRVTFALEAGQPVVLNGPNGCGKSTLLKTLAGLVRPASGSLSIRDGTNPQTVVNARWLQVNARLVQQQPPAGMFADLTLAENLALFAKDSDWFDPYFPGIGFRAAETRLEDLLVFYRTRRGHRLSELSGGQQQLFTIACAAVGTERLLLFDEPTSALDATAMGKLKGLLRSVCLRPDVWSLIVSHDSDLAALLSFSARNFDDIQALQTTERA
jgi:ABC-type multidrug transport system ATPase subunit